MNVPVIELKGSPFEKGFIHGSQMKKQVMVSLETYAHRYSQQRGLSWEDAKRLALRFTKVLTGEYEVYLEEMRGIAQGAGLELGDILALNLRSEILYSSLKDMHFEADECTAFSAIAPATKDGHALAGQSWDFNIAQREASFIARIPAEGNKPAILMFLEGGMVGGKGVSSAGMCLTLNALTTPRAGIGIPLHVRMRSALECKYLTDAMRRCLTTPIPGPVNFTITHKDGLSFSMELDPDGAEVLESEDGLMVHTNHYIGQKMRLSHPHSEGGSTYIRLARMKQLMKGKPLLTIGDFEDFLKDHAGYPSSICAHPSPDVPADKLKYEGATNYAFVADLTANKLRFVMGNPCEGSFEDIEF